LFQVKKGGLMRRAALFLLSLGLTTGLLGGAASRAQDDKPKKSKTSKKEERAAAAADLPAVLWRDPGDIAARDLVYGMGGKEHAPAENAQYKFVKEDLNGTSTKFYIEDSQGVQWLLKIGEEAKPETAATHLVWSMGYLTDEDYYLPQIQVTDIPHLKRGNKEIPADGTIASVRLKRQDKGEKKIGNWSWFDNPFVNTRELDGLRVMMALIDNWDLKAVNNKIYSEKDLERRYVASDEGASFGRTGGVSTRTKGNLKDYQEAKFIDHVDGDHVDFVMATRPLPLFAPFELPNYVSRTKLEGVTKHIPRANAKWIGEQLSRLTTKQVGDAFRAAGFSDEEVEGYTRAVMARIAQLNAL
jgi:hypothetical protein